MMPARTFEALMDARRKQRRGEDLTEEQQELLLQYPEPPVPSCGCGCGRPMNTVSEAYIIDGVYVLADCWFEAIGLVVENHPVLPHSLHRRAASAARLAHKSADEIKTYLAGRT